MENNIYANIYDIRDIFFRVGAPELVEYLIVYQDLDIEILKCDPICSMCDRLSAIDEALSYEEFSNNGFGNRARMLRKEWKQEYRKIEKHMKRRIKYRKQYNKEWSKPKQVYISRNTGECHNGIYWTIRACIDRPVIALGGFTKEK